MKSIYSAISCMDQPSGFAIATVISSSGSAPGKPGSSALISAGGLIRGTVGGGIVEKRVLEKALRYINKPGSGIFHFNLDNPVSGTEDAICGGDVKVLIDSSISTDSRFKKQLREVIQKKIPFVVVTSAARLQGDEYALTRGIAGEDFYYGPEDLFPGEVKSKVSEMIAHGKRNDIFIFTSGEKEKESFLILESVLRPPHLIIAGAGHIGKAVCMLGNFLGFEVTVIDDRPEYASRNSLPSADNIIVGNIGEAMRNAEKDKNTFIVIVTRGHSNDAEALRQCIGSDAAYVGMIGSRTKTELMRKEFISKGWATPEQWQKIHTPVGIRINSETAEEIAVSIAAELVMVKNTPAGKNS